jgi:hypothetical protein
MALISNLINPITSYYEGQQRLKGATEGARIANQGYDQANQSALAAMQAAQNQYSPYALAGSGATSQLMQMLGNGQDYETPQYEYGKSIADFYDPAYNIRMQQGMNAMDQSAATRGGLFDSGYGKQLQQYGQDLASEEYGNSFNRMQQDKQSSLQQWTSQLEQARANRQQRMSGLENIMSGGMNAAGQMTNASNNYYDTTGQNAINKGNMNANVAALKAQNSGSGLMAGIKSLAGLADVGLDIYSGGAGSASGLAQLLGLGGGSQQGTWGRGGQLTNGGEVMNSQTVRF